MQSVVWKKKEDTSAIIEIPIELIDSFPNHPFRVKDDEEMKQLVDSIRDNGIITPIIVRQKENGRYEIISGHRRTRACQLAGLDTVSAEIRYMSEDEAIIMMVDSNLQRSVILPSEKALAYKMRLEAMRKVPGRPSKKVSPLATNLTQGRADEELAELVGEGKDNIRRYIRLNELIPELVKLVDEGRMGLRSAVELSYLTKEEQRLLVNAIEYTEATPSHYQARRLRALSNGKRGLNPMIIEQIMEEEKPNQHEKICIMYSDARRFIPAEIPYSRIKEYIMKVLEDYYTKIMPSPE